MNSKEKILSSVRANQPENTSLPDLGSFTGDQNGLSEKYRSVLEAIGGKAYVVKDFEEIRAIIADLFADAKSIVSTCKELAMYSPVVSDRDPHLLEHIDLAIINGHFGVAENASVWVTEDQMSERVLPFICQYLAAIIYEKDIVATMHEAYDRIGMADYGFGTFIAGPSKTADIEQSLVLGAHGPKGMTVFIIT
ncbi:MAG: LUD domain-containing protein [Chitinophagaceae bacterium]